MVSSWGAASHLLATDPLSSPVLHRLLRAGRLRCAVCERQVQFVNKAIVGRNTAHYSSLEAPAHRRWPSGNPMESVNRGLIIRAGSVSRCRLLAFAD